jgi:hypothetical protein
MVKPVIYVRLPTLEFLEKYIQKPRKALYFVISSKNNEFLAKYIILFKVLSDV